MAYPRGIKPNYALNVANVFAADLGTPALADVDRYFASAAMHNGAYTLLNDGLPGDGNARNVTATQTANGTEDTNGTLLVTGLNVLGQEITETLIPNDGATVAGTKAFASVSSIVGAGWVTQAGADTITLGFGNLIGLPSEIWTPPRLTASTQLFLALLAGAIQAATVVWDADEIEKNTIDASAGTFDGAKRLIALILR
jgi:hypothetical protein